MRVIRPGRNNRGPAYDVERSWLRSLSDSALGRVPGPDAIAERMRRRDLRNERQAKGHSAPIDFVRWIRRHRKDANPEQYWQWRESVLVKHGYRCKLCGKHGIPLEAHHVLPWRGNPRHRYDVSNGWALCRRCHAQVESGRYFVADISRWLTTIDKPVVVPGERKPTEG